MDSTSTFLEKISWRSCFIRPPYLPRPPCALCLQTFVVVVVVIVVVVVVVVVGYIVNGIIVVTYRFSRRKWDPTNLLGDNLQLGVEQILDARLVQKKFD